MMTGKKHYTLEIEPLTAVHIGSGRTLNPLDYKLGIFFRGQKERIYLKYNTDNLLQSKAKDEGFRGAFDAAVEREDFGEIRQLFHSLGNRALFDFMEYPCYITDGFSELYDNKIDGDPTRNALSVLQMYHPAGKKGAVIPGSSIKGAVRTAVLNYLLDDIVGDGCCTLEDYANCQKKQDVDKNGKYEGKIQSSLLGISAIDGESGSGDDEDTSGNDGDDRRSTERDPFRCVAFADVKFSPQTQLVGALKNVKFDDEMRCLFKSGIQILAEVIPGKFAGYTEKAITEVSINEPLQNVKGEGGFAFGRKFTMEDIARACNRFFKAQFEREYNTFYRKVRQDANDVYSIKALKKIVGSIEENDTTRFFLRVGRWSQVEYVTLDEPFRNPLAPKGFGASRTLFDMDGQWLPMGWCLVTVVPE